MRTLAELTLAAGEPWMRFRCGGAELAVPAQQVERLAPLQAITPVPLVPPRILGLMNLSGDAVPLLDVARFLGLPTTPWTGVRAVLVCAAERYRVGLVCERAIGVEHISPSAIGAPELAAPERVRALAIGELATEAGVRVLLDLDRLLDEARVGA